jgi:N-acetylglucosamine-6-sulfatase
MHHKKSRARARQSFCENSPHSLQKYSTWEDALTLCERFTVRLRNGARVSTFFSYPQGKGGVRVRRTVLLLASVVLAMLIFVAVAGSAPPTVAQEGYTKPNFVFILADYMRKDDLNYMPKAHSLLEDRGMQFTNAFVTNPICCPSQATILRGQYSHNHGVLTNSPPQGGFEKFESLGREESTVATWLHGEGYRTVLTGKYRNGKPRGHKPKEWDVIEGGGGKTSTYPTDHYARKASEFVRSMKGTRKPFFIYLATKGPHAPAESAPRHADAFPGAQVPRPPSFNEQKISDKPTWIHEMDLLGTKQIEGIDELYRNRLRSMLAIDEMLNQLVESLRYSGKLENTYIFFTSDNGKTMGEHGGWRVNSQLMRKILEYR